MLSGSYQVAIMPGHLALSYMYLVLSLHLKVSESAIKLKCHRPAL